MSSFWKNWLIGGLTLLGGFVIAFWFIFIDPFRVHRIWSDRIRANIQMLAKNRPANVNKGQWDFVVGWTINLHANCGTVHPFLKDLDWRDPFALEFERRLSGPITLADIEWIWDEYARHTKSGQKYSDNYRPTRQEGFDQIKEATFGIEID